MTDSHSLVPAVSVVERIKRLSGEEYLVITEFKDGSGAVGLRPIESFGPQNAILFNCDGTFRTVISINEEFKNGIGFSDAYYVNGEMTLIFTTPIRDFACVIDELSGQITKCYETR